jgi:PiT family inorganic phosphate transporter
VATGSIFGASVGRHGTAVQWRVIGQMVMSWLLTLPAAATVGGLAAWVAGRGALGTGLVAVALVAPSATAYRLSRRNPVTAANVNDEPDNAVHVKTAAGDRGGT